jgi:5'-nucleotidase/UDP-sugar diphosphatase
MLRRLAVLVVAFAGSSACTTIETTYPALEGQDVRLTLLHTSDLHSRLIKYRFTPGATDQGLGLDPTSSAQYGVGGVERMAYIVRRERGLAQRVLHLDSGDGFQGAPIYNLWHGEPEYRTMSQMGVDAAVVGNHEFDSTADVYAEKAENYAKFPLLVANYEFRDWTQPWANKLQRVTQPFTILQAKGLRVGVVGMGNLDSLNSITDQGNSLGVLPLETIYAAQRAVDQIRPLCDVVVVVSHMGLDSDTLMAKNLHGVDVILGGHLHIVLWPPKTVTDPDGRQVIIAHSGAFAKYVGRLDLVLRKPADALQAAKYGYEVVSFKYNLFPLDVTVDQEMARTDKAPHELAAMDVAIRVREILEPYRRNMALALDLNRTVGCSSIEALKRFGNSGGDSPLGNITAEAMQLHDRVRADFGLTNSPGIRDDLRGLIYDAADPHVCLDDPSAAHPTPVYSIRLEELYNVLPFENTIATMYLSGPEVQELFDYVARRTAERGCSSQAQVSGVTFTLMCGGDAEHGWTPHSDDILIGGKPISRTGARCDPTPADPSPCNGTYKLATNDYVAAGGSGYDVLKRNTTQVNTYISMRDAVAEYLDLVGLVPCMTNDPSSTYPDCAPGYVAAGLEDGRITVRY